MVRITEVIFKDGVLRPVEPLDVRDGQRFRITMESLDEPQVDRAAALERVLKGQAETRLRSAGPVDRDEAIRRFREGQAQMQFKSEGPYPTRDELHERR